MSGIEEQIADLWKRVNRIEAAMDEIAKGFELHRNDKAYDDREQKKKVT